MSNYVVSRERQFKQIAVGLTKEKKVKNVDPLQVCYYGSHVRQHYSIYVTSQ